MNEKVLKRNFNQLFLVKISNPRTMQPDTFKLQCNDFSRMDWYVSSSLKLELCPLNIKDRTGFKMFYFDSLLCQLSYRRFKS